MYIINKLISFIKKAYRKYKFHKDKKYFKYVRKILILSKLELSKLTPYDKITKLDIQEFPSSESIRLDKFKIKNFYKDNVSKVNPVCTMLELYASSNKVNIKRISRKYIFKHIMVTNSTDLRRINLKTCLHFIRKHGALIDNKETEELLKDHSFINKELIKDLDKYSILNYYTIENIRVDKNIPTFNRDEIIILKIKDCICKGIPVLLGIELYSGFIKATKGTLDKHHYEGSLDKNHPKPIGVYGVNIVGYNSDNKNFLIYTGWGNKFGDKGFFLLPYKVLLKDIKELWYINNLTITK